MIFDYHISVPISVDFPGWNSGKMRISVKRKMPIFCMIDSLDEKPPLRTPFLTIFVRLVNYLS
jgi:hypothetical protein